MFVFWHIDFLRYCEYELLHLILDVDMVFSILGVAIVKAELKSLFWGNLFFLTFNVLVSLVNSISAFRYYCGLNFLFFYLLLLLDLFCDNVLCGDFFILFLFWFFIFITSNIYFIFFYVYNINLTFFIMFIIFIYFYFYKNLHLRYLIKIKAW